MSHRICCIIGTRPEILKMAPVVNQLQKNPNFEVGVLLTAQHREMLDQMLTLFDLPVIHDLNIMQHNQSLSSLTARLLEKISTFYADYKPDMTIAQGDTTTTLVSALACFYTGIPYAYVESGLRSNNFYSPFPEEMNRQFTSRCAALNFAPTKRAKQNLLNDNIDPNTIYITGNTIIDTLLSFSTQQHPCPINTDRKIILVTCHRRENLGNNLENICAAINRIVELHNDIEIVYPVHPNPNVKEPVHRLLQHERIHLLEPMGYPQLIALMQHSYFILTDSGGLQEEAPALDKPVLVMRTETERPEGVEVGAAKLVGVETENIVNAANELLQNDILYNKMANASSPYGDGRAGERIAHIIANYFAKQTTKKSTQTAKIDQ